MSAAEQRTRWGFRQEAGWTQVEKRHEYLGHYHEEPPHQSLKNEPITAPKKGGRPTTKPGKAEDEIVSLADVRCKQRLGGLMKSYCLRAA